MADYKLLEKDFVPWSQIVVHNYFELITVHNRLAVEVPQLTLQRHIRKAKTVLRMPSVESFYHYKNFCGPICQHLSQLHTTRSIFGGTR
jgi:hypothetical protein